MASDGPGLANMNNLTKPFFFVLHFTPFLFPLFVTRSAIFPL